jgi:DNA-directed RNA polymerase subunit F
MWSAKDNRFIPIETASFQEGLGQGVFTIQVPMMGPTYLERIKKDFHFGYKIYGMNDGFVSRVQKTFDNTTGNLGILLNGLKGTGKSVTAELISNAFGERNMPTVLITSMVPNMNEFLAGIHEDVVVFIDEFEKVFSREEDGYRADYSSEVLTIMDGALKSEYRRVFIFTTNRRYIDDNLLSRPGRIRYAKEYGDLSKAVIEEVVDDLLENVSFKEEIIEYILGLEIITIDIVKSVIQECNIHNETPETFKDYFNVVEKGSVWNLFDITDGKNSLTPAFERVSFSGASPDSRAFRKGQGLRLQLTPNSHDEYIGEIASIDRTKKTFGIKVYDELTGENSTEIVIYSYEKTKAYHVTYSEYAL